MDRRSFLLGTGTLTLSQLLAGCGGEDRETLRVQLLKGSIPAQLVNEFRATLEQRPDLQFAPTEQLKDLFKQLESWSRQTAKADNGRWQLYLPFIK